MIPQVPPPDPESSFGVEDFDITEDMEREFSPQRKVQNMAMINTRDGSQNASKETTDGALIHSVSRLGEAAQALTELADKLCGQQGLDGNQKPREVPNGFFDLLAQMRTETDTFVASIFADIERIRARL